MSYVNEDYTEHTVNEDDDTYWDWDKPTFSLISSSNVTNFLHLVSPSIYFFLQQVKIKKIKKKKIFNFSTARVDTTKGRRKGNGEKKTKGFSWGRGYMAPGETNERLEWDLGC